MCQAIIEWMQTFMVAELLGILFLAACLVVQVIENRRLMERLNELPEPHRWRALSKAEWQPWPWMTTLKEKARAANLLRYGRRARGL